MSAASKIFATLSPRFQSPEAEFELFNCQASENLSVIEALLTAKGDSSIGVLEGLSGIGRSYAVRSVIHRLEKERRKVTYLPVDLSTWNGGEEDRLERYATALIEEYREKGKAVRAEVSEMVRTLTLAAASMSPAVLAIAVLVEAQHHWKLFRAFFNEYGDGFRADPFSALAELLARLAREGGAVLHIDPLEALPDPDLRALCAMAERIDGLTLLFSSSEEVDIEDRFRLARHAPREIRFEVHDQASAAKVIDRCFQPNDFPPALSERLYEYSSGHPRVLAGKLFELVSHEAIFRYRHWSLAVGGMENHEVVGALVDHFWRDLQRALAECPVPRQVQEVLARAAICGRYLPLGLVVESLGLTDDAREEVIDFIDDQLTVGEAFPILQDLGFHHPSFPGRSVYRFVDPFVREAILWNLGDAETASLAEALLQFLRGSLEKPTKGAALIFLEVARFLEKDSRLDPIQDLRWWIDREMTPSLTRQIQQDLQDGRADAATLWIGVKEVASRWPAFRVVALLIALDGAMPQTELGDFHALRSRMLFMDGHYKEALRDAEEALSFYSAELSPDHHNTLGARAQVALCTGAIGQNREALSLLEGLLPDVERVLGEEHPNTLTTRANIAAWTGGVGGSRKALALFEALLPDLERVLGDDHPHTLNTRNNIAAWTGEVGDSRKALALFEALLPDLERVLGDDHPHTLNTRNNIAAWTGEVGDSRKALALFEALLPDLERVLGDDHPDTLTTRNSIARWTGEVGDSRKALVLFEALLPDRERVLGADHPDTLTTRHNIASSTGEVGESRKALAFFEALLPDRERVLGPDHPDTLATRNNIASWMGEVGDSRKALALFEALLPDLERVLGEDHPDTLATAKKIEELKEQL